MTLTRDFATRIAVVFYFFSVFSITANELFSIPSGLSLAQPFVIIIFFISAILLLKNTDSLPRLAFFSGLILIVSSIINAFQVSFDTNFKNLIFVLFFLSTIVFLQFINITVFIKYVVLFSKLALILTVSFYSYFVLIAGVDSVEFYNLMPIKKQDLTSIFSVHAAILVFGVMLDKSRTKVLECCIFLFLMIVLSMKSVLLSMLFIVLVALLYMKNFKVIVISVLAFLLVLVLVIANVEYLPDGVRFFVEYFISDSLLYDWQARRLDTFYIREYIFNENISHSLQSVKNIFFGNGYNVVEGEAFISDFSGYQYIAPDFLESGLLFYFVYFGLIGLLAYIFIAIYPVVMIFKYKNDCDSLICSFVCMSFFVSNIFQDNVNAVNWFILGLGWAVYKKESLI